MKNRKIWKILAFCAALVLIVLVGISANGMLGNPISKARVTRSAQAYIDTHYPDCVLEDVRYDFKMTGYHARVSKPGSLDIHFSLDYAGNGTLQYDSYPDHVTGHWTTMDRLNQTYRELCRQLFENPQFSYAADMAYGVLLTEGYDENPEAGLSYSSLETDGLYNIQALGRDYGILNVSIQAEEASPEFLARVLLDLRKLANQAGIPFRWAELSVRLPEKWTFLSRVSYGEITEEGMTERVTQHLQEAEIQGQQEKID